MLQCVHTRTYIGIGVVLYCKLFTEEYDSGVYLVFIYECTCMFGCTSQGAYIMFFEDGKRRIGESTCNRIHTVIRVYTPLHSATDNYTEVMCCMVYYAMCVTAAVLAQYMRL